MLEKKQRVVYPDKGREKTFEKNAEDLDVSRIDGGKIFRYGEGKKVEGNSKQTRTKGGFSLD